MDHVELTSETRALARELLLIVPESQMGDVVHLVDHGEPEEAVDLLVAILVRRNVPITPGQRERVRALMQNFDFSREAQPGYQYLADPEMLDRMTVVDEPAP